MKMVFSEHFYSPYYLSGYKGNFYTVEPCITWLWTARVHLHTHTHTYFSINIYIYHKYISLMIFLITFPLAYFKNTVIHIFTIFINPWYSPVSLWPSNIINVTGPKDQVSNCPILQLFLEKTIWLSCANFNNDLFLPSHLKTS